MSQTTIEKQDSGEKVFSFGQNWKSYINELFSEERLAEAKKSLVDFCGKENIENKKIVDVGCGSGLFSLSCYELGAAEIKSFDVDKHSVECCKGLKELKEGSQNWSVEEGSALDRDYLQSLGQYDLVYSWGVLHHTGNMWEAIKNTSELVAPDGLLYISIYNKVDDFQVYFDGRFGSSKFWLTEKKFFVSLPNFIQNFITNSFMVIAFFLYLFTFKNPVKTIEDRKKMRGMSLRHDIKDWLGGYPYEYASVKEIFHFMKDLGFQMENINSDNGLRCNEFLFRRAS